MVFCNFIKLIYYRLSVFLRDLFCGQTISGGLIWLTDLQDERLRHEPMAQRLHLNCKKVLEENYQMSNKNNQLGCIWRHVYLKPIKVYTFEI